MLKKIVKVQGVGLFCDAQNGARLPLERLTLIYGENARGRSTLASIFSSAGSGDPSIVFERATIDSNNAPYVLLRSDDGAEVKFEEGQWTGAGGNLRVFDSTFVERNVHSGNEISSDHRKNLLDFALGEKAVQLKQDEKAATEAVKDLGGRIKLAVQKLLVHSAGMSESAFIALHEDPEIDRKIEEAIAAVNAAVSRRAILNQALPVVPAAPTLNVDHILSVLAKNLDSAHAVAEEAVLDHIRPREAEGFSEWIADGQRFLGESASCPFCGQGITNNSLIASYQLHFNQAYRDLKIQVDEALKAVDTATEPGKIAEFKEIIAKAREATDNWKECGAELSTPGVSSVERMEADLSALRNILIPLFKKKRGNIDQSVCSGETADRIRLLWSQYAEAATAERKLIAKNLEAIEAFKASLSVLDEEAERQKLERLRLVKKRYETNVVGDVKALSQLRDDHDAAIEERKRARDELKKLMDSTLATFGADINKHLEQQFASFCIDRIVSNYMGSTPRTQYGILLRRRKVNLSGDEISFGTCLSESDKRTMAFAFFLASTFADPDLSRRTIVVDDPMSSLDRNRRANTVRALKDLAGRCEQLIVLAHDPKFLMDVESEVVKIRIAGQNGKGIPMPTSRLKLVPKRLDPELEPYTDFEVCDLTRECESKYAAHYRTVSEFVDDPSQDSLHAAAAIRPLLEGYLHRRYPNHLPVNCMFGQAVSKIESAVEPSPLVGAQSLVSDLRRIAYFGGDSHHNTEPDIPWEGLSSTEILGYATETLKIVHGDK